LAALVAGTVAIWLLRQRPDWAFVAAIATMVLGSPTVSISWYALFFAMLAPLAWPWRPREAFSAGDAIAGPSRDLSPASG
jgi:hypothetical protein